MPTYTGAEIAEEARNVHLNRAGVTDLAILPIINSEYEQLQQKMIERGVSVFKTYFSPILVTAGNNFIPQPSVPPAADGELPANFVEPIILWERAVGGLETDYVKMKERSKLPHVTNNTDLVYWAWEEEKIKFVTGGATTNRQVKIYGFKTLPLLDSLQDTINIGFSKGYLGAAVAARAALTISHNANLAMQLKMIANEKLDELMNKYTRKTQSLSTRRRGYRRPGG